MFELTKEEYDALRCKNFTSNARGGNRYLPFAFTREGIAMLSGLLRSEIAVQANISIMRAFFQMQEALLIVTQMPPFRTSWLYLASPFLLRQATEVDYTLQR